jgi:rhodanese-related sulfurtransferase
LARGLSCGAAGAPLAEHPMDEISPQDLKARLAGSDRPFLLDVRQDWETRLCRLENAVHIPIEEIEVRADELNADDEIVVYCHQGVRSAAVADYLRQRGFKNVKNLLGGLDYWARTVDPAMRRY